MSTLAIELGSSNYAFEYMAEIPAWVKPQTGDVLAFSAELERRGIRNAPWSITGFKGVGLSIAHLFARDPDFRLWSEENMNTLWEGVTCKGPQKLAVSYPDAIIAMVPNISAGVNGEFFVGGVHRPAGEGLLYLGSNGDLLDTTLDDESYGFGPVGVVGIFGHKGRTYVILDGSLKTSGSESIYVMRSDVGSTTWWNIVNYAGSSSRLLSNIRSAGGISDGTNIFAAVGMGVSGEINIRKSTDDGVSWATRQIITVSARSSDSSEVLKPRGFVMFEDGTVSATLDPWISTGEALYWCDDSANSFTPMAYFLHPESAHTGKMRVIPTGKSHPSGLLIIDGPGIRLASFGERNEFVAPHLFDLEDGLPSLKQGDITSVAYIPDKEWVVFGKGGLDASHNAGLWIWKMNERTLHNIYYNSTANRAIQLVDYTTETDGISKIIMIEDNGTANDSSAYRFERVDLNPRSVTSWLQNTDDSGELVFSVNSRYLEELDGIWRQVEGIGTNFSTARYITVYKSADAAPIDTDGSWTQLQDNAGAGDVIDGTNATVVYHPATPNTTGESAKRVQYRLKFTGASNDGPFLEVLNIYVDKVLPIKFVRSWVIDLDANVSGTIRPKALVLSDLRTIAAATSSLSVLSSEAAATNYRPYLLDDGPLKYRDKPFRPGTIQGHQDVRFAVLTLEEV